MKKTKALINLIFAVFSLLFLVSCTPNTGVTQNPNQGGDEVEPASKFVYSDTCIVVSVSKNEPSFTFQNLETGLRYTLSYDNLTFFTDRYKGSITGSQVSAGQICDISFYREEKQLKSLEISGDYFAYSNVEGFKFYNSATRLEYLGDKYELDENLVVCSGRETIDVLEIADSDIITIHGFDHVIYSITVDKGHGFVSLDNDSYFIDGFIEIEKDIRKITEGMILTVPEGRYNILISKDGTSAVKEVTVGRNQEAHVDLGDIEIKKNYGTVNFTLTPSDAFMYIDGEKINDVTKPVKMEYGIHEIIVRADGYETLSKYISVGAPSADVSFKLTKLEDESDKDKDKDSKENSNDTSTNTNNNTANTNNNTNTNTDNNTNQTQNTTSTDNTSVTDNNETGVTDSNPPENTTEAKVYIDAPQGAELYLDGNYMGVVPVSFAKKIGTIVITLKKDGCQTRSYTINLEEATTDSRYSFSELLTLE